MSFSGKTNLHLAIEHRDVGAINALSRCAHTNGIQLGMHCFQEERDKKNVSLLKLAIEQKEEHVVKTILGIHQKPQTPFGISALILKESFKDIWNNTRIVCEEMLTEDTLSWNMFILDIPYTVLNSPAYLSARVGTCEECWTWKKTSKEAPSEETLRVCDTHAKKRIEEKSNDAMMKASIKVFCIEDACKISPEGILRFLLSQETPSYLYKAPLIKWIIIYKWECIWRKRSLHKLLLFVVLLGTFTFYTICIGFYGNRLQNTLHIQVFLTLLLFVMVFLTIIMFREEKQQLETYIKDGKKRSQEDSLWGLKHYLDSYWNIMELIAYAILMFLVFPLHFLSFACTWHLQVFYLVLALESVLIWFKVRKYITL